MPKKPAINDDEDLENINQEYLDPFSAFEGLAQGEAVDDILFDILRFDKDDNKYKFCCKLPSPCSFDDIRKTLGGGKYVVRAMLDGKHLKSKVIDIDEKANPPRTYKAPGDLDPQIVKNVQPDFKETLALVVGMMAAMKSNTPVIDPESIKKGMLDDLVKYKEILGTGGSGMNTTDMMGSLMGFIQQGLEIGRSMSGKAPGKDWTDVVTELAPRALDTLEKAIDLKTGKVKASEGVDKVIDVKPENNSYKDLWDQFKANPQLNNSATLEYLSGLRYGISRGYDPNDFAGDLKNDIDLQPLLLEFKKRTKDEVMGVFSNFPGFSGMLKHPEVQAWIEDFLKELKKEPTNGKPISSSPKPTASSGVNKTVKE